MIKFFRSLKTSLWLMGVSILLYVLGSFFIPQHLDIFSEINDMPLMEWLNRNRGEMGVAFWIPALIVLMALLAANILVCGYDSLARGVPYGLSVETLAPQVLHLGVVLVLFGHLISAASGFREDVPLHPHEPQTVRGRRLELVNLEFLKMRGEDSTRWRIGLLIDGRSATVEPARPYFHERTGYFARSASQKQGRALIGIVYDPGVIWEVAGAILFLFGGAGLFFVQFRRATDVATTMKAGGSA